MWNLVFLQVDLSPSFSSYICNECRRNILQFVAFRTKIIERQQKLSNYLNEVKEDNFETNEPNYLVESQTEKYYEPIVIKTEKEEFHVR
jgi:hypothetical protein